MRIYALSRRRRVYHQFRKELYIIKAVRFVYHQAAGEYTLTRDEIQPEGLMIYTLARDDMPSLRLG